MFGTHWKVLLNFCLAKRQDLEAQASVDQGSPADASLLDAVICDLHTWGFAKPCNVEALKPLLDAESARLRSAWRQSGPDWQFQKDAWDAWEYMRQALNRFIAVNAQPPPPDEVQRNGQWALRMGNENGGRWFSMPQSADDVDYERAGEIVCKHRNGLPLTPQDAEWLVCLLENVIGELQASICSLTDPAALEPPSACNLEELAFLRMSPSSCLRQSAGGYTDTVSPEHASRPL